jgi:NADPH:quinone reductase-like Zn-dependent oxidoreductase
MRAVRLREVDGRARLVLDADAPVPVPRAGEVLLAVRACGLNQIDLLSRDGRTPKAIRLPHVPGTEVAGEVAAIGPGVEGWSVGDRAVVDPILACGRCEACRAGETNRCREGSVYGVACHGGYAQYAVAPARQLAPVPKALSFLQAASIAVTGPTAWHMLRRRADVRVGEAVLVIAAGSGIGVLGIQIAKAAGARVIATAGSDDKLRRALELGADDAVHHGEPDWAERVRGLTGGRGVDVVFEHVGRATWAGSLRALARGGRLVTCGGHSGFEVGIDLWHLFVKEQTLLGSYAGTRRDFDEVMRMAAEGRLRPVIQETFPLERTLDALALLEDRKVFGKLMLDPTMAA